MPVATTPKTAAETIRTELADLGGAPVEALFPEADQHRTWRRFRLQAAILVTVIAAGVVATAVVVGHGRTRPTALANATASLRAGGGIPAGEPSSEVVTDEEDIGNHTLLDERWATTLGPHPQVREWDYSQSSSDAVLATTIDGVEYVPNANHSAVRCPRPGACAAITSAWVGIVPPKSNPPHLVIQSDPYLAVQYDPILAVSSVRLASTDGLTQVGTSDTSGIETTEYHATITGQSLARIKSDPRVQGIYDSLSEGTRFRQNVRVTVTLWVDKQGRLRKIEVPLPDIFQGPAPDFATEHGSAVVTLGDFGKPVPLTPPANATLVYQRAHFGSCQVLFTTYVAPSPLYC